MVPKKKPSPWQAYGSAADVVDLWGDFEPTSVMRAIIRPQAGGFVVVQYLTALSATGLRAWMAKHDFNGRPPISTRALPIPREGDRVIPTEFVGWRAAEKYLRRNGLPNPGFTMTSLARYHVPLAQEGFPALHEDPGVDPDAEGGWGSDSEFARRRRDLLNQN